MVMLCVVFFILCILYVRFRLSSSLWRFHLALKLLKRRNIYYFRDRIKRGYSIKPWSGEHKIDLYIIRILADKIKSTAKNTFYDSYGNCLKERYHFYTKES